jgi:hypothetical protein
MGKQSDSFRTGQRRVCAAAKGKFLTALRGGARIRDAAAMAGFATSSFYRARDSDPAFAEAWGDALDYASGPIFVAPHAGRRLQLRRTGALRFTEEKQELFLAHFAGTGDVASAAEAAGISVATVYRHRARDAEFAARFDQALQQAYIRLEAELVRQRIEAQDKLEKGILPAGEVAAEFERALKLLTRWERRDGRIAPARYARSKLKTWSFEDAMLAVERKLRALKIPIVGEG